VLEEAVVLGGEDRLLHHLRHVVDVYDAAPLLAELPDQHAVGGPDPQRHLGTVVGQDVERRQAVGRQHRRQHQGEADGGGQGEGDPDQDPDQGQEAEPAFAPRTTVRREEGAH
jgi:hypothetical protein